MLEKFNYLENYFLNLTILNQETLENAKKKLLNKNNNVFLQNDVLIIKFTDDKKNLRMIEIAKKEDIYFFDIKQPIKDTFANHYTFQVKNDVVFNFSASEMNNDMFIKRYLHQSFIKELIKAYEYSSNIIKSSSYNERKDSEYDRFEVIKNLYDDFENNIEKLINNMIYKDKNGYNKRVHSEVEKIKITISYASKVYSVYIKDPNEKIQISIDINTYDLKVNNNKIKIDNKILFLKDIKKFSVENHKYIQNKLQTIKDFFWCFKQYSSFYENQSNSDNKNMENFIKDPRSVLELTVLQNDDIKIYSLLKKMNTSSKGLKNEI